MKATLARFLTSTRRDEALPTPAWVKADPQSRRFASDIAGLEQALKSGLPASPAPPGLHCEIMRAVRQARANETRQPDGWKLFLCRPGMAGSAVLMAGIAVLAVAAFLILGSMGRGTGTAMGQANTAPSLAVASSVLELGDRLPAEVSASVFSPLEAEQQKLRADLNRTAEHLLACIP